MSAVPQPLAAESRTDIESILDLTREVLGLAERGEWLEATRLDSERQRRLQTYCAALEPQKTPPVILNTLGEILKLNDALIGAVQHRQRALVREADTVRIGRRAVAAYHSGA